MDRRRMNWITAGTIVLVVLAVAMTLLGGLHRSTRLVLPDDTEAADGTGDASAPGGDLTVVEVTPETVQAAIATLERPAQYRRTIWIEQFWDGGSGSYSVSVAVGDGRTRVDRTLPDGRVRHAVTNGVTTYIWYDGYSEVYSGPADTVSADDEQDIPTYEEVLALPVEDITAAGYQMVSNTECIYVEAEERDGYSMRYWVSVDTGLLVAAEKLLDGETVYRMASPTLDASSSFSSDFTLPDGTLVSPVETP